MPNHVHGIIMVLSNAVWAIHAVSYRRAVGSRGTNGELPLPCARIQRRRMLLPKVVGYFKMNTTKLINFIRNARGTTVWQRNYYEHIIHNDDQLQRLRDYLIYNPARWHEDPENSSNPP